MTTTIPVCIVSGFLGAGKTTLIQNVLQHWYAKHPDEQLLLIENDFGDVNFDANSLSQHGVQVQTLTNGCICCSLSGDFQGALLEAAKLSNISGIIIEPSGVGKLSDIRHAFESPDVQQQLHLAGALTVIDAKRSHLYVENFGPFFIDQLEGADTLYVNFSNDLADNGAEIKALLRTYNTSAPLLLEKQQDDAVAYIIHLLEQQQTAWEAPKEIKVPTKEEPISKATHEHQDVCECTPEPIQEEEHVHDHTCTCGDEPLQEMEHVHDSACTCGDNHIEETEHVHDSTCTCGCHHGDATGDAHDHAHHEDMPFITQGIRLLYPSSLAMIQTTLQAFTLQASSLVRAKGIVPTFDGPYEIQYHGDEWIWQPANQEGNHLTLIGTSTDDITRFLQSTTIWEVAQ